MELIRLSKENRKLRTQLQVANQTIQQLEQDKITEVCLSKIDKVHFIKYKKFQVILI